MIYRRKKDKKQVLKIKTSIRLELYEANKAQKSSWDEVC